MGNQELLKAVGYWRPNDGSEVGQRIELPDPRWLVRRGWRHRDRRRILAYLRAGHTYEQYAGYSYCRFWLCLVPPRFMGDSDLTDGVWVWPEGLAHYVHRHWVCLPEEFIATMEANGWQPPREVAVRRPGRDELDYDLSFWLTWSRQQQRRPWYSIW
jgi:hypothetical protein